MTVRNPGYCPQCGKPEHGSVACSAAAPDYRLPLTQKEIGLLVRCLNCGILWRRVTTWDSMTLASEDYQLYCPACFSNAYEPEREAPKSEKNRG